jgi:hypothetical protein
MYKHQPLIVGTILASVVVGFAWGFVHLPTWALAPILVAAAWWVSWTLTAEYDHDRPALIGSFIVFLLIFSVSALFPAAMINTAMN